MCVLLMKGEKMQIAEFHHLILLVNVTRTVREGKTVYDAARFAWKVKKSHAERVRFVLARCEREIVGTFIADRWLEATPENFPCLAERSVLGRYGFEGREASLNIQNLYVGKAVPDEYISSRNPIKYIP